jgi:hypothetical protein
VPLPAPRVDLTDDDIRLWMFWLGLADLLNR